MSRYRDFESKPQSLSNRQHHESPIFYFGSSVKISAGFRFRTSFELKIHGTATILSLFDKW